MIGWDISFIGLVETDAVGDRWVVVRDEDYRVATAEAGRIVRAVHRLRVGGAGLPRAERSFVGHVAHLGQSRRSGDVRGERYYRQSNPDMKSELAVPIMLDGAVLGVINLESAAPNAYTRDPQRNVDQHREREGDTLS